ncbi:hypothetical protein [Candidatus Thiosymbion oneisti]|uniref:hypothetical protein n=1 Tax=Candidatus Thiosymbion oneisti TaxID=589554 RepID=UPI00114CF0B8|nr:hypothetical protein [Candidatus Thiosymbion oneisti]
MTELDDLIHLSGHEIKAIHDSVVESGSGLKGSRPDLSVEALVGRIHSNLIYNVDTQNLASSGLSKKN